MAEDGLLHTAELIKTALPYVDIRSQLILDLLVKLYELIACLRNLRTKDMAACGFGNTCEKVDAETLLKKIRPNCNQKERAFVDKILSIFQAKRVYEMYNTYMEAIKTMEDFDSSSKDSGNEDNGFNYMASFSDLDLSEIVGNDDYDMTDNDNTDNDIKDGTVYNSTDDDSISNYDHMDAVKEDNSNRNSGRYNNELIESLKAMIPPEQMETFENLRILFETMSYDDNEKSESDKE